jgi:hypothetical protein
VSANWQPVASDVGQGGTVIDLQREENDMKRTILVAAALVAVLAALVVAAPASAATVQVSGDMIGTSVTGGLVGTWYTDSLDVHVVPGSIGIAWPVTGTEHFVGCIDTSGDGTCNQEGNDNEVHFTFTFTASASGNGRCQHPIVQGTGTGQFSGATGVITMKDRPTPTGLVTTYDGHIKT